MEFYPNTYYMTVYEELKDKDGKRSLYDRMMHPSITYYLMEDRFTITKDELKSKVEKLLSKHIYLEDYNVKETENGWKYERFVKWMDEDGIEYENVQEGEHTDHELYTVEILYFERVSDAFLKLPS